MEYVPSPTPLFVANCSLHYPVSASAPQTSAHTLSDVGEPPPLSNRGVISPRSANYSNTPQNHSQLSSIFRVGLFIHNGTTGPTLIRQHSGYNRGPLPLFVRACFMSLSNKRTGFSTNNPGSSQASFSFFRPSPLISFCRRWSLVGVFPTLPHTGTTVDRLHQPRLTIFGGWFGTDLYRSTQSHCASRL